MTALKRLARYIKTYNSEESEDYALVHEAMGSICLTQGRISEAKEHKNNIRIIPNRRKDGSNVNHLF